MTSRNKEKSKDSFLHPVSAEKYRVLLGLANVTFKVPKSNRTNIQRNAVRQYQRRRAEFSVVSGVLYFKGKKVVPTCQVSGAVKKTLKRNLGSGSRSTWRQMKRSQAGVTYRNVKGVLNKSQTYQQQHPRFQNKVPPKPVTSNRVNERWQIDLVNMQADAVSYKGKSHKYILSIIDTFSRFLRLRPLTSKKSAHVAKTLRRVFAEHGTPKIIQCDQGNEFKGAVDALLKAKGIKVIRSSPYHPQSQGKCERSHQELRSKISFKVRQHKGFNWAKRLHEVQEAINDLPKEVLNNMTPSEVFSDRGNVGMRKKVNDSSRQASTRMIKKGTKKTAIYREGERVFVRYPPSGRGSQRFPRRRYACKGIIVERDLFKHQYLVTIKRPNGTINTQWVSVTDLTAATASAEKNANKRSPTEEWKKQQHKKRYYIVLSHKDNVNNLNQRNIKVLNECRETVGSCQFEAVGHQLSLFGIHRTAASLREEAVCHIRDNEAHYARFIVGDFNTYTNNMLKKTTYGDHVTLLALSRAYNVQFLIASADGPDFTTLVSPHGQYSSNIFTLTLGYFPEGRGEHYVSVGITKEIQRDFLATLHERQHEEENNMQQEGVDEAGTSDEENNQQMQYEGVDTQDQQQEGVEEAATSDGENSQQMQYEGVDMQDQQQEGVEEAETSHTENSQQVQYEGMDTQDQQQEGVEEAETSHREKSQQVQYEGVDMQDQQGDGVEEAETSDEENNQQMQYEGVDIDKGHGSANDDGLNDTDQFNYGSVTVDSDQIDVPKLPHELEQMVINEALNIDIAMAGSISQVSSRFYHFTRKYLEHNPERFEQFTNTFYIRSCLAEELKISELGESVISVRKLVTTAGPGSGLSQQIRKHIKKYHPKTWWHAWVKIGRVLTRHNGWYRITSVFWKKT